MYTVHRFCAAKKKLAGYWAPDSLTSILTACLHGGEGPQVGEVTRSGGVKK